MNRITITKNIFEQLLDSTDASFMQEHNVSIYDGILGSKIKAFSNIEVVGNVHLDSKNIMSFSFDNCKFENLAIGENVANIEVNDVCDIHAISVHESMGDLILNSAIDLFYVHKKAKLCSVSINAVIKNVDIDGDIGNIDIVNVIEKLIVRGTTGAININKSKRVILYGKSKSFKSKTELESLRVKGTIGIVTINNKVGNVIIEKEGVTADININGRDGHFTNKGKTKNVYITGLLGDCDLGIVRVDGKSRNLEVTGKTNHVIINGKVRNVNLKGHHKKARLWGSWNICNSTAHIDDLRVFGQGKKISLKQDSTIKHLTLKNASIEEGFHVELAEIASMTIEKQTGSFDLYIEKNSVIGELDIRNTLVQETDSFYLKDSKINRLTIENVINSGFIYISNIEASNAQSIFSIDSCVLGNTHFISTDLSKYENFYFYNSSMLDCFYAGSNLKVNFNVPKRLTTSDALLYDQKRLFYSQVKKAHENQGDSARAMELKSFELEAHRKKLAFQYNSEIHRRKHSIPSMKSIDLWNNRKDRIVLYINKISSNYSTNWLRATVVTLVSMAVLYSLYLFLLGYRMGSDFSKFWEMASHSFSYLNPLRDEDTGQLFEVINSDFDAGYLGERANVIPPFGRIVDYLGRIIIAFLVYQTIASFRRLGKSSN